MAPRSASAAKAQTIDHFLEQEAQKDLLRFITCGSVDDGKSTLIGRLLWDAKQLYEDQLSSLQSESEKYGTQKGQIDFALLVDGLSAEREQGITIDVAYRFFATQKRKFIVADTPGHEQYTRNMITGASTADAAIILVDANQGILTQTRRHAYLTSLMGIKNIALAVNKMDMQEYGQDVYSRIEQEFREFAKVLGFASITAIPLSALEGENITASSAVMPWYNGPYLMEWLENVETARKVADAPFIFPVQWVNRPDSSFRGFAGKLAGGEVKVGDEIRITQSGQTAKVARIVTFHGDLQRSVSGESITLTLDREVDASRGDVITHAQNPIEMTDQCEATVVWMHEEHGLVGRNYDFKLANQWVSGSITAIKHKVNPNNLANEPAKQLGLNDIAVCKLSFHRPVSYTPFAANKTMGSFIVVDRFTHATVGVGMIQFSLRRAQNVHAQPLSVTREHREKLNGHKGRIVWFTGLSGSGKSSIANALEIALHQRGYRTYILDGDNIRHGVNKDLGFTEADRVENIRRVAEVSRLMMDAGLIVITSFISPFAQEREMAKQLVGADDFVEIHVDTPLKVCEERDVKGLYKKARKGQIPNMTGINSPYEIPASPDIRVNGTEKTAEEHAITILKYLENVKRIT